MPDRPNRCKLPPPLSILLALAPGLVPAPVSAIAIDPFTPSPCLARGCGEWSAANAGVGNPGRHETMWEALSERRHFPRGLRFPRARRAVRAVRGKKRFSFFLLLFFARFFPLCVSARELAEKTNGPKTLCPGAVAEQPNKKGMRKNSRLPA
jgi:hypothetical protein